MANHPAIRRHGIWHQDREFVSTNSRNGIGLPHRLVEDVCKRLQCPVPGPMAKRVVQALEIVNVDCCQTEAPSVTLLPGDLYVDNEVEAPSILQSGQGIGACKPVDRKIADARYSRKICDRQRRYRCDAEINNLGPMPQWVSTKDSSLAGDAEHHNAQQLLFPSAEKGPDNNGDAIERIQPYLRTIDEVDSSKQSHCDQACCEDYARREGHRGYGCTKMVTCHDSIVRAWNKYSGIHCALPEEFYMGNLKRPITELGSRRSR